MSESNQNRVLGSICLAVLVVSLGAAISMFSCERERAVDSLTMAKRAAVWGHFRASEVELMAQELAFMHPMSERSKSARKARILLDDLLRDGMPDDDEPAAGPDEQP
ncbi:MAG: hypothetical protein H0U74_08305 [Bradymonadaceae bacterium]|nr:hypothetical protein [Lujinxingiaceae bacterium]